MGEGSFPRCPPVLGGENFLNRVEGAAASGHFEEGAHQVADHLIQERFSFKFDPEASLLFDHFDPFDRPDWIALFPALVGEGGEVVGAQELIDGGLEKISVERVGVVERVELLKWALDGVGPQVVVVDFAGGGKAGMETVVHLLDLEHADVFWEEAVE